MAAVYLKNLLLNFLSHSYNAGYCWEDVGLSLHGAFRSNYIDLAKSRHFSQLPSLCFGPGFPRSDFAFGSSRPIVTKAAKASRYEYGYLTLPAPTIPLPMTLTTAPGALEFPFGGITKPGRYQIRCGISYMLIVCRAIRRYRIARRLFFDGPAPLHIPRGHGFHVDWAYG